MHQTVAPITTDAKRNGQYGAKRSRYESQNQGFRASNFLRRSVRASGVPCVHWLNRSRQCVAKFPALAGTFQECGTIRHAATSALTPIPNWTRIDFQKSLVLNPNAA